MGPEFISAAMHECYLEDAIKLQFTQQQNRYIEKFNRSFREYVLDANLFGF
jgi:hypothetical protein